MEFNHRLDVNNNSINFINTYDKDNPMLKVDDECYFLFTNVIDFHYPLIAKGLILQDKFTIGLNKCYYIELKELYDNEKVLEKYFYPMQVSLHNGEDLLKIPKYSKYYILGNNWKTDFLKTNLFKVEAFFVRKTLNQIINLRNEYCEIIKFDLQRQIKEIDNIIKL